MPVSGSGITGRTAGGRRMMKDAMRTARPDNRASRLPRYGLALLALYLVVTIRSDQLEAQPAHAHKHPFARRLLQLAGWEPHARLHASGLREVSGVTKSPKHENIYWVHGDSGQAARLYAVRADGEIVARMDVTGAANVDWEDITADDEGHLYIGDIGDNVGRRARLRIYRVAEPDALDQQVVRSPSTKAFDVQLPDGPENCESLFWWRGDLYVITKEHSRKSPLYRLEPAGEGMLIAKPIGRLRFAPITGAEVSADGERLLICGYGQIAVIKLGKSIDGIEDADFQHVRIPPWLQIEGCCFDGDDVIVTAEDGNLWRVGPEDLGNRGEPAGSP